VRERTLRADDVDFDDDGAAERATSRARLVLDYMLQRPVDSAAGFIAGGGVTIILVNALFLQSGPHPAPIFANRPPVTVSHSLTEADTALPRVQSGAIVTAPLPHARPRPRAQIIADIQRELARRGYYGGSPDGVHGPKTDAAIREFEQVAQRPPSEEPTEELLAEIVRSPAKPTPAAVRHTDPIANLLAVDPRIMAVQRALSSYGYGQIKTTGVYDPETRAAIERFERERRMPVTGRVSERLTRELTALTGRPLE
jgi:peptidoglycan hydrolase-like protein with peptidoglycan-binding domain